MNPQEPIIILDISANTHKNDENIFRKIIDEVATRDIHNRVVFKGQLFQGLAGDNIEQDRDLFAWMVQYAWNEHMRKLTASVFDMQSLLFLLGVWKNMKKMWFEHIPFVKIANNRDYDVLTEYIPRGTRVMRSLSGRDFIRPAPYIYNCIDLLCVSKYPATKEDYLQELRLNKRNHIGTSMAHAISDHTEGLELYKLLKPRVWEKHVKLPDSTGLDAGPFAITPQELEEVLS